MPTALHASRILTATDYQAAAFRGVGTARLALARGAVNRWDERDGGITAPFAWVAKFGLHVAQRIASWNEDAESFGSIQRIATNAETVGAGNCMEHAAVCFVALAAQGIRPIDYVSYSDGSHAFVVLGLDLSKIRRGFSPTDTSNWNAEATVADAWMDEALPAKTYFGKAGRSLPVVSWCRLP